MNKEEWLKFLEELPLITPPTCDCDDDPNFSRWDKCTHWNGGHGYDYCYQIFTKYLLANKGDVDKAIEEYDLHFDDQYGLTGFQVNSAIHTVRLLLE